MFPRSFLVAAIIFPHTKWLKKITDYRDTPALNARTQPSFDQTDDGVDAETSLSLFLSLFMSISLLRLFSRAHYWVNKYILKSQRYIEISAKNIFLITMTGSTSGFLTSRFPAIRFLYKVEEISVGADSDRPYFPRLNSETYI